MGVERWVCRGAEDECRGMWGCGGVGGMVWRVGCRGVEMSVG